MRPIYILFFLPTARPARPPARRLDTLLTFCCFEAYRKNLFKHFHLDIGCYFYGLASYAYQAAFYSNRETIELISCRKQFQYFENALSGGFVSCVRRLYRADESADRLIYADAKMLYGS